jgi:hypothetical protein
MRKRRWLAFVALLGLMAVVPEVGPAAAAGTRAGWHWRLALAPVTMTVEGTKYHFRVIVGEGKSCDETGCAGSAILQVIGRSRDRSLVASVRQENLFEFDVDSRRFRQAPDLSAASVHAESDRGGRVSVDLKFASDGPATSSCDGHTRVRPGTITGTFRFRPVRSKIGTVTKLARRAALTYADGTCRMQPFVNPTFVSKRPCDPGTVFVIGQSSPKNTTLGVIARRDPDADTATINVSAGEETSSGVWYTLRATVPADHVRVSPDLSSTHIRSAAGSNLTGTASSAAEDPTTDQPAPWPFPFDCESAGAGATMRRPLGPFHGDLSPLFWAGRARSTDMTTVLTAAYLIGAAP